MQKSIVLILACIFILSVCSLQKEISGIIEVPDAIFKYIAKGKGIPCVAFLGGENLGHKIFSDKFHEHFLLIHADPGHLSSEAIDELTLEMILDDIEKLRKAIGYDKIGVYGHSAFGTFPLEYALKYPDNIAFTISTGAWPFSTQEYSDAVKKHWESASEERKRIFKENMEEYSNLDMSDLTPAESFVKLYKASAPRICYDPRFDLSGMWEGVQISMDFLNYYKDVLMNDVDNTYKYHEIEAPVLVISGLHDNVAPYFLWDEVKNIIPNFTFHLFENAGHNPMLEVPEEFDKVVIDWIESKR